MTNIAIKVENLSKLYRIGEIGTGSIGQDVDRWFKTKILGKEDPFLKIGEMNDRASKGATDIVYSLRDINFEINQGDAVGIIGRNGAGKSTLLKILSRVTTPTTGRINIKGRVASLLEVGTGFHPELTGRENIYLNGAILGMRKSEIDRKLDEIIDFSGVERYIDTPVKRYSSGMYVRLAFAVAAHLESEILIVDEVLAVGDAEFQKKCLGKMDDVSRGQGRTVLFVSHNMSAVQNLCDKGLLVSNGKLEYINSIDVAINKFIKSNFSVKRSFDEYVKYYCDKLKITDIGIYQNNKKTDLVNVDENSKLKISFEVKQDDLFCTPSIVLKDNLGNAILSTFHGNSSNILVDDAFESKLNKGNYVTELIFPPCFFNNKMYSIDFYFSKQLLDNYLEIKDFIIFDVVDNNERFLEYSGEWIGTIRPKFEWKTEVIS